MPWTFYNANGQRLSSASTSAALLDIDGGLDEMGAPIVDADLLIIDDADGGNKSVLASRIKTYVAVPAQAVKSAIEGETNQDTYIPPDLMKHHPGVAKVTCKFETVGASHDTISTAYGMSGVSEGGALGDSDVSFTTNFANTNYIFAGGADQNQLVSVTDASAAVGGCTVIITTGSSGATVDTAGCHIVFWGTQ